MKAHHGQGQLSEDQHSRIFHDLSWQEKVYNEAQNSAQCSKEVLAGTMSDDESREIKVEKMLDVYRSSIRGKRTVEGWVQSLSS